MADDKQDKNAAKVDQAAAEKVSPEKGGGRKTSARKASGRKPVAKKPTEPKTMGVKADAAKLPAEKLKAGTREAKPLEQAAAKFAEAAGEPDELPAPDTDALKVEASAQAIAAARDAAPVEPSAAKIDPAGPASESAAEPDDPETRATETTSRPEEEAPLAAETAAAPAPKRPDPHSSTKPSSNPPAKKPKITQEFVKMTDAEMMTKSFQSAMAEMTAKSQDAYKKSSEMFKEAGEFTKGNLEAMMEATKIFAAGMQEMSKAAVADSKSEFEAMTAEVKEMASVKSPTDFFQMQSALLRKNFDKAVALSSKNTEAMLKLANDASQPLSSRMSLAMERIKAA